MRPTLLLVGLGVALAAGCVGSDRGHGYEVTMLVLPDGHAEAGREAFVGLGCTSCHQVAWEKDLPVPVAAVKAPELGETTAATSPGMLATAIIAPSHYVPAEIRKATEDHGSPMGDFTEAMTVRQLIDVVAYLKSGGDSGVLHEARLREQP